MAVFGMKFLVDAQALDAAVDETDGHGPGVILLTQLTQQGLAPAVGRLDVHRVLSVQSPDETPMGVIRGNGTMKTSLKRWDGLWENPSRRGRGRVIEEGLMLWGRSDEGAQLRDDLRKDVGGTVPQTLVAFHGDGGR